MRLNEQGLRVAGLGIGLLLSGCNQSMLDSKNSCVNNLRLIDEAEQVWALENHKTTNDTPNWNDLRPYIRSNIVGSKMMPLSCPTGGKYSLGRAGRAPRCSVPEHEARFLESLGLPDGQ